MVVQGVSMSNSGFLKIAGLVVAVSLLSSCLSTIYRGPTDLTSYAPEGKLKSASQSARVGAYTDLAFKKTYDDEFVYDSKGNVVKQKRTEYFWSSNKESKYVVWETEFKLVGDVLLPRKVSANGIVYLEVEYEILPTQAKGIVSQATRNRYVEQMVYEGIPLLGAWKSNKWAVNLEDFPVSFRADDKFIVRKNWFSSYSGIEVDNILSLGYDNIVLKRYSYSFEKLSQGVIQSFPDGIGIWQAMYAEASRGNNYEFNYDWKVIAGQICQTKTQFKRNIGLKYDIDFVVDARYNDAGQRTSEVWTANDSRSNTKEPTKVFEQTVTY